MSAAAGAAAGGKLGSFLGPPGTIGGALVGGLVASLPFFLMGNGMPSEEEQERMLRRQLEIQDEFERKRAGGEMGDLAGLVGGGRRDLAQLMNEAEEAQYMADVGESLGRLGRTRNRQMDELEAILAGETARIAQLQSPRTLTPLEIIAMVGG